MADSSPKPGSSDATLALDLFRQSGADLRRFLRKRLHDPQQADDVMQEVFSRLVRVHRPEFVKKPHSYLFGIAFHVIREMRLQEDQEVVKFDSLAAEEVAEHPSHVTSDKLSDQLNVQVQVQRALAALPDIHRALVLMCKRDGMTYDEAAAATGISVHMVEKYLIQARAKLLGMMWDL